MKHQQKISKKDMFDDFQKKIDLNQLKYSKAILAYLVNFKSSTVKNQQGKQIAALLCYFVTQQQKIFKCYLPLAPYLYLQNISPSTQAKLNKSSVMCKQVQKQDLDMTNHLSGKKKKYHKVQFKVVNDLINFKKQVNQQMREYDISYSSRVCIDLDIRAGKWFKIWIRHSIINKLEQVQKQNKPHLKIMSFDIETSKKQFKFPDPLFDQIMMISLMYQRKCYLLLNKSICLQECKNFKYQIKQKPEFNTQVIIINAKNQKHLLQRFAQQIQDYRPSIITSYNGDKFDWDFIQKRADKYGLLFASQFGVHRQQKQQFYGRFIIHMDCFYWVQRDSMLPHGSRGLKAVTKSKLDYNPIQLDPQQMVELAKTNTQKLAQYSVSDAVATYFLYEKIIHDFIFALCTIIPLSPDEVLRRGSGTLCQNLLMTQAYKRNIIFPNKSIEKQQKFYHGHLIDSQTYIGGKVQCLRSGVYRNDIAIQFKMKKEAFEQLYQEVQQLLQFSINKIENKSIDQVQNIEEIKEVLKSKLSYFKNLQNIKSHKFLPLIYHLDVAAMYPNIILTNRLQPTSIVNNQICSGCIFNKTQNNCKRELQWQWKGQYFPLMRSQFQNIKYKLLVQMKQKEIKQQKKRQYQIANKQLKKRIKTYCQKNYQKVHINKIQLKHNTVCMRENSFYVDAVRAFRDRRYIFKAKVKLYKNKLKNAQQNKDQLGIIQSQQNITTYQSLQLAHKIILNSFYGYVMKKGSRWYSMEMAAMVTHIGSQIISQAKNWVQLIGCPLQLDTDGIWLLLPQGFPQYFKIKFKNQKEKVTYSYPCLVLNKLIFQKYCNKQYQTKIMNLDYQTRTQMSIMFEVDGPYKAMIIPAANEMGKMLKKRYVVINHDNKITQLKGFQIKRRGQLKLIKMFQSQIFIQFLKGSNMQQLYSQCAETARKWLKIILCKGQGYSSQEILQHIQQSRVLSKQIDEYDKSKGVALTCAKRLRQFFGDTIDNKGINCKYIITKYPSQSQVTDRSIPVIIFNAPLKQRSFFLSKWLKQKLSDQDMMLKNIVDWDYYLERISSTIQKIIIIPAYLQTGINPLPQIGLPKWLVQCKKQQQNFKNQKQITSYFTKKINQTTRQFQQQLFQKPIITPLKVKQLQQQIIEPQKKNTVNPYNPRNQFSKWLAQQKKIWANEQNLVIGQLRKYIKKTDTQMLDSIWNIIQIIETNVPGVFKLWIMSNYKLLSIQVHISRKLFLVNSNSIGGKKLPRQRTQGTNELIMNEKQFISQKKAKNDIYELNIPLQFKMIASIGNMCKVYKNKSSIISSNNYFQIQQLRPIFYNNQNYLQNLHEHFAYIPMIGLKHLNNHLWIFFDPRKKQAYVFITSKQSVQVNKKQIKQNFNLPQNFKIIIQHFIQLKSTVQTVQKYISMQSSLIIIWALDVEIDKAKKLGLHSLYKNFPVVQLQNPKSPDDTYVINWQSKCLKALGQYWSKIDGLLFSKLAHSRYSFIPIGNLNSLDQTLDVLFARQLQAFNYIWWYKEFENFDNQLVFKPDNIQQEINKGRYEWVIQVGINFMSINTIINIQYLCNTDKQTARLIDPIRKKIIKDVDQLDVAKSGFKMLRNLLKRLYQDTQKKRISESDELLVNAHKWICNSKNPFYDPLLERMLDKLMSKIFSDLIQNLKGYGIKVVYGNFDKLLLSTSQKSLEQCQSLIRSSLQQCRKLPQFKFLIFNIKHIYQNILFYDNDNYIAIQYIENDQSYFVEQLQMVRCKSCSQYVAKTLANYVQYVNSLKYKMDNLHSQYQLFFQNNIQNYVQNKFKQFIFQVIELINARQLIPNQYHYEQQQDNDNQIDSFIQEDMPKKTEKKQTIDVHEFVKYVVQMLSVDSEIQVFSLYQECCKKIDVGSFTNKQINKAQIKKIKNACKYCNSIFKVYYGKQQKSCPFCSYQINMQNYYQSIQKQINIELTYMFIQDLYCDRCKRIKSDYLSQGCQCGGSWIFQKGKKSFIQWIYLQQTKCVYLEQLKLVFSKC